MRMAGRNVRIRLALLGLCLAVAIAAAAGCQFIGRRPAIGKSAPSGELRPMGASSDITFPASFQGRAVMISFFSPG